MQTALATTASPVVLTAFGGVGQGNNRQSHIVINPYKNVDWRKVQQHRAALHIHTLQSDGQHMVDEVVNAYRRAGYTIMSITDHDTGTPNRHVRSGRVPEENASPFPREPKPDNYPANTTWPWSDYGCSSPENLHMIGIEGNELSNRHHINSYFNNSGWYGDSFDRDKENWEDYELETIRDKGGFGILCHPGWARESHRKPLEWYVERFRKHPSDYLLGIETTNNSPDSNEPYDIGLWDQLLARFMPHRPVWGFGDDDMHGLTVKQTFNVFLLDNLTDANVRSAMQAGQFFFTRSSRNVDYRPRAFDGFDVFPKVNQIVVNNDEGTITITATDYDEIRWISSPVCLETTGDYKSSNSPWALGSVVHKGRTLDFRNTPGIKNYVRAELHRKDGEHIQRTFTNPFGIQHSSS